MISYFKNFVKFFSYKVNLYFVLVVFFFVIFFGFSFVTALNKIQAINIEQIYHKGELVASSGANSIHVFLEMTENSLLMLSRNTHIINQSTDTQNVLDDFVMDWKGTPIIGVGLFDKDGSLRYVANNIGDESSGIVDNLISSNRDYFIWAETASEGDTYLGKPLLPKVISPHLQYILPVVTPIYRNGEFDGALLMATSLPKLTATYIDPLQVSPGGRVYLMHPDSTIMATMSGYEGLVGLNYFEYLRNNPYPGSEEVIQELTKALGSDNGGRLDTILYSPANEDYVRFLIAYSPVKYNDSYWTMGLAIPFDDVSSNLTPFKKDGIMLISLFLVVAISLSAIGMLLNKINRNINSQDSPKVEKNDIKKNNTS